MGSLVTRSYHLHQLSLMSRELRVIADGTPSAALGRDMSQLDASAGPRVLEPLDTPEEKMEVVST